MIRPAISFFTATAIIIHLAPNGEDQPNCGASSHKCKTVDYALNQTEHNNITLVFETSTTESLKYNLRKQLHRNESIFLRFTKDDPKGVNPTIYGQNIPFVGERVKGDVRIEVDSIDLHNVFLLNVSNTDSFIFINITASSIYLNRSNFTSVKQAGGLFVKFNRCTLKSPAIIEGKEIIIDKYFWLDIELKENSNESNVTITDTTISGGRFHIENVRSFEVSKCRIENNIPTVPDGLFKIYFFDSPFTRTSKYHNLAKLFPTLSNENRITNSTLLVIFISAEAIFKLETVKEFVFVDSSIQQTMAVTFFYLIKVNGVVQDTKLMNNLFFRQLIKGEETDVDFSHISIQNFRPADQLSLIDLSEGAVRITNFTIASMQSIDRVLQLKETQCEVDGLNIMESTIVKAIIFLLQLPPYILPQTDNMTNTKLSNLTICKVECGWHILTVDFEIKL